MRRLLMRGRTLDNAYIILDGSWEYNTGADENVSEHVSDLVSKVVITGDLTQKVAKDTTSGLDVAMKVCQS